MRPLSTSKLLPSEQRLVEAMRQLRFGRFERLRIENGQVIFPPPLTVRVVRFGCDTSGRNQASVSDSPLKQEVVELLEYIRSVRNGEITILECRHGLPFAMEITLQTQHGSSAKGTPG